MANKWKKFNPTKYGTYNIRSEKGRKNVESVFETAIETADLNLAKECIQNGVNPNIRIQNRDTALHLLAEKGNTELGELLLSCNGIRVDVRNEEGNTPLHVATICEKRKYVLLLLGYGANPNIINFCDKLPLHFASEHNNFPIVQDLLRYGSKINVADIFGNTPLSLSVIENPNIAIARILLRYGARPSISTLRPLPLMLEAVLNCNSEKRLVMIDLLVTSGVDINVVHPISKMTPLHMAAITGYLPVAKYLAERGANMEARDVSGRTPIGMAKEHGRMDMVQMYIEIKNNHFQSILKNKSSGTDANRSPKYVSFVSNPKTNSPEDD